MNVFCRTATDEWRRVYEHDAKGLEAGRHRVTFLQAWRTAVNAGDASAWEDRLQLRWDELLVPLPELSGPARAYALTYRAHQEEARLQDIFCFEKGGSAEGAWNPIPHRAALDYEAEVALLLHRGEPDRFGFLLANDLTDRNIQIRTYNRRRPAQGFTAAKSFPGALRIGPLLVVGRASIWPGLEVRLRVNAELRQRVNAGECLLAPRDFYEQLYRCESAPEWVLVLTGTAAGTVFQSPTLTQRLQLFVRSGFSVERAGEVWLKRFTFLRVGDRLDLESEILGRSHARIVAGVE